MTLYDAASLRQGFEELLDKGAVSVYASGPIDEGTQDGLSVTHAYDIMRLSRSLRGSNPPADGRLTLSALTRPAGPSFLSIYNESIIHVLNRPAQSIAELSWLISTVWKAGIAYLGDTPVGVYECKCVDSAPEIVAVTILEQWRGKGLGRELLRRVLALLSADGPDRCTARVSTDNAAFPLLRAEGFRAEELLTSWYAVSVLPQQ